MTTRFLMNDRKEKAMKAFGMGGYKRGGHVTEIAIMMGAPKGMKKSGMGCNKSPVRKSIGGSMLDAAFIPSYLRTPLGLKKGGMARNKMPVKKSIGGDMLEAVSIPGMAGAFGLKKGGRCSAHKKPMRKADGGPMATESPEVEQNIDTANQMLLSRAGLRKGGKVNNGRVKKSIGGEIQKAGIMGLPGYFMNQATSGYKRGGRARKADGGSVGLSQMSSRDFDAGKNALGLRRGGTAKSRVRKAYGGSLGINSYSHMPPTSHAFSQYYKSGGDVRMAAGGVGKMRHHQMSKSGKPIKPRSHKY